MFMYQHDDDVSRREEGNRNQNREEDERKKEQKLIKLRLIVAFMGRENVYDVRYVQYTD